MATLHETVLAVGPKGHIHPQTKDGGQVFPKVDETKRSEAYDRVLWRCWIRFTWPGRGLSSNHKSRQASKRFFRTVMVDEYNTSKMCAWCGAELQPSDLFNNRTDRNGVVRQYTKRGLRKCRSTSCCQQGLLNSRWISRDVNGTLNIRACISGT